MRMLFKQRIFSWLDSYDIYDESGRRLYEVKGQVSWGHCLKIYDAHNNYLGMVKEAVFTFLPRFDIYLGNRMIGSISKQVSCFAPRYKIDCKGWYVEGDFMQWNYYIKDRSYRPVASISKKIMQWSDTYSIDVADPEDAITALMVVIAIDAENCTKTAGGCI